MAKPTTEQIKAIGEELRTTRYKASGKMAFRYVYDKYEHLFKDIGGYDKFLELMKICAIFFASQGELTSQIRAKTVYTYV